MEGVCPQVMGEFPNSSGRVGSTATLTIDAGSRFVDGPYEILWSTKPITEETTDYIVLVKGEVPKNSTKVTVSFTIPEAPYGRNYVQFRRLWRPESPYGFIFNVLSAIKVEPQSGAPGTEVTIKGTGFPANCQDITISFDGQDCGLEVTASGLGSFSATFTIPQTIAGSHQFQAATGSLYLEELTASFQVVPEISIQPQQPEIGEEVTISGSGFAASSQITIEYDDITISDSPTTDANGSFSHSFPVPESTADEHVIVATDAAGNSATYELPLEDEPPPAPNPVHPCQGERFGWFGPQLVVFRWQPVEDPSGITYTLEVGSNTSVWPPTAIKEGLTTTSCTLRLEPGTYYWHVKAIDGAGNESSWALAPYPFTVGLFSVWYLITGGLIFLALFLLLVRAFFRRLSEYLR